MHKFRVIALLLAAVVALVSCNSDPNVAKKKYLDRGNVYFDRGKYTEANIMYRRALEKDKLYGAAYYKLGLTSLKQNQLGAAVYNFRRAVDLLSKDSPDRWDALIKWTDIFLAKTRDKQPLAEAEANIKQLLAHDPNSFDGHRMSGDLDYIRSIQALQRAAKDEGKQDMDAALVEYRKADSIKPGEAGVTIMLARGAEMEGDAANAEQYFRKVIEKNKTEQAAYSELYRMYMFQGRKDDGEKLLKLGFQNNPKNYSYLSSLALHYSYENRRQDMLNVLQQIKSHSKEFPQAFQVVGDFYVRLGDRDAAIREYKEGIAKDPAHKAVYEKSEMQLLIVQGKRAEAVAVNQQILKDDPNDSDARTVDAGFLLEKGDIDKANAELQSVVTRSPNSWLAHYNLGRVHVAKGEWEQARQSYQKAIDLNTGYLPARMALAQLLITRGENEAALKAAQEILQVDRQNRNAELIETAAYLGQKKYADATKLLNEMLTRYPSSPDVLYQLGSVSLAEGKYKEAYDFFKRTYELNPTNSRGLMGMVETDMAENKPDEAIKTLEVEAAKAPNRMDLQMALGETQARAGHFDSGIGYFQRVLNGLDKTNKARGEVYVRIGEAYRRKGDFQSSIGAFEEARKFLPDNTLLLSSLALVFESAGKWTEARQIYTAAIKMDPNNAVSLNNLAMLMADHGTGSDLDQALTMAQKAKQLLPGLNEVSDTLGWIYLKKNLNGDALDIFQGLVAKVPNSSTFRYHLAKAYFQQGDKVRAKAECQSALRYNPTPDEKNQIQDLLQRAES